MEILKNVFFGIIKIKSISILYATRSDNFPPVKTASLKKFLKEKLRSENLPNRILICDFDQACGSSERGSLSGSGLERSLVVSGVAVPTKAA